MKFPNITHYIESVLNIEDRLRTLRGVTAIMDRYGEPLFYSSKGYVTFVVQVNGTQQPMRCFTSMSAYQNNISIAGEDLIDNELFVFDDNQAGDHYPILLLNTNVWQAPEIPSNQQQFNEGVTAFEQNGLWGYMDEQGTVVVEAQYDSADEFGEGRAVVSKNGLYGLIDRNGKIILETIYDEISWDGSSIAYLNKGGKTGCSDRTARQIVECKYDWKGEFSYGLLLVRKYGKYGYIDLYGTQVIPLIWDSATSFDINGVASVRAAGRTRIINTKGEIDT